MRKLIKGEVIKGNALGRKIGFPTLNLKYDGELRGVFAVKVLIGDDWLKGAMHVGGRPTIDDNNLICEVYVLDWSGNYEGELMIEVYEQIRGVEKFDNIDRLVEQLSKDVECVRMIFDAKQD